MKQVLGVEDKFEYEYDFGSTTHLQGQVFAEREGVFDEQIRILARNTPPRLPCDTCGTQATDIDVENEKLYCQKCFSAEFGDEYDMVLAVVNSPRMGVCGYTGHSDFDDFNPELESASEAGFRLGIRRLYRFHLGMVESAGSHPLQISPTDKRKVRLGFCEP